MRLMKIDQELPRSLELGHRQAVLRINNARAVKALRKALRDLGVRRSGERLLSGRQKRSVKAHRCNHA